MAEIPDLDRYQKPSTDPCTNQLFVQQLSVKFRIISYILCDHKPKLRGPR